MPASSPRAEAGDGSQPGNGSCTRRLAVPVQDQYDGRESNACGTTSASMVLDYLEGSQGRRHHSQLDQAIRRFDLYTPPGKLVDAVRAQGFRAGLKTQASVEELRGLIDQGLPAQVLVDPTADQRGDVLHWMVVSGYQADAAGQVSQLVIHDPAGGQVREMARADFERQWSNLQLKGVSTGLDRVLVSFAPSGEQPVTGGDGQVRSASALCLPGERGPGLLASGRPGLCVADGISNLVHGLPEGNLPASVGGVVQTLGGGVTLPLAEAGRMAQRQGAARTQAHTDAFQEPGVLNRATATAGIVLGSVQETSGQAIEGVANFGAAVAEGAGRGAVQAGESIRAAGAWMGDALGRWWYR